MIRLSQIKEGERCWVTIWEDFTPIKTLMVRLEEISLIGPTGYACLDIERGIRYQFPPWQHVELYLPQPADILSTPVDE